MAQPVYGTPWQTLNQPVSEDELAGVDRYWRAANYLSVGQIYLRSNPLMKDDFSREDVKHRLVGHWGTTPGLNFLFRRQTRVPPWPYTGTPAQPAFHLPGYTSYSEAPGRH